MVTTLLRILIALLLIAVTTGCTEQDETFNEQAKRVIGRTTRYTIVQVNDTVLVCLPGLNTAPNQQPTVINLKAIPQ